MQHSTDQGRQLIGLYVLTAVLMLGYGAIFSLLAEIRDSFGLTSADIGFIGGAAFAAGFVAQLGLSRFADLGHGALMLRIGLAICIVSTAWMVFADSLIEWLLSRGGLGFGSGMVRPAVRRLVITIDKKNAGRALGTLSAYETTGFLIGPVVAATLNAWSGLPATFIVMTALMVLTTPVLIGIKIPGAHVPPPAGIVVLLLRKPAMQSCMALGIAFWITIGVFEAIWAIFLSDLGASQIFIGLTMSLFCIPMIAISPFAGAYAQRKGTLNIAIVSIAVATLCMVLYGMMDSLWLLCIPLGIHAIADAFTMPASQLAVAQASGENAVATGQGLFGATGMAVGAVTAVAGGLLYQELGATGLWWISAGAMAVCLVFAWWRGTELRQPFLF